MVKIGIIGGSGLDNANILEDATEKNVSTSYGEPSSSLKIGKINNINATINYSEKYNLTTNNKDEQELLTKSSAPYKMFISNNGEENNLIKINFEFV